MASSCKVTFYTSDPEIFRAVLGVRGWEYEFGNRQPLNFVYGDARDCLLNTHTPTPQDNSPGPGTSVLRLAISALTPLY
jgi:hypothetical protein